MRYGLAVVLVLATGLSGQELIPGTARPLIENLPANTSGFICPMHPNEVKADAGHVQHLRHDARGRRSDGDGGLRAARGHRAARAEGRTEDEVSILHPCTR